ncbi:MAG: GerW family sporulation protein [Bacillota bacterium]
MDQKDTMEGLLSGLSNLLSTKTVVGDPITMGDVTLVPIVDVMFGFGSGSGTGGPGETPRGGQGGSGSGSGGGGGGRVAPKALVMIKNGEVSVLSLVRGGTMERIIEMVPEVVGKLGKFKGASGEEDKKEDAE